MNSLCDRQCSRLEPTSRLKPPPIKTLGSRHLTKYPTQYTNLQITKNPEIFLTTRETRTNVRRASTLRIKAMLLPGKNCPDTPHLQTNKSTLPTTLQDYSFKTNCPENHQDLTRHHEHQSNVCLDSTSGIASISRPYQNPDQTPPTCPISIAIPPPTAPPQPASTQDPPRRTDPCSRPNMSCLHLQNTTPPVLKQQLRMQRNSIVKVLS